MNLNVQVPVADRASALAARELDVGIAHNLSYNRPAVLIPRALPFGLLPRLVASIAPSFNKYTCIESGQVALTLQAVEPDNQRVVARILKFPSNGTLYNVNRNGSRGAPVSTISTHDSETVVEQWVSRVAGYSGEWGSTADYLTFIGSNLTAIENGLVDQV